MSRGLPIRVSELLDKAKESCLLAVDVYNKPKTSFRSGAYILLMSVAWTSLFHAIFEKKNIKYYYKKKNSNRYEKIDGEYKSWELNECLKEYFKSDIKEETPIRKNIEFFIPLRNKIEHRFMPGLDLDIFGECQALLHNFEYILYKEFGSKHAISEDLVFSLQFAKTYADIKQKTGRKNKALERLRKHITDFRKKLDDDVFSDQRYSFKIYLLPKLVNNKDKADYAIEWVNYDQKNPDEMKKYTHLMGVIKEKIRPISNYGYLKAGEVSKKVREELVKLYGNKIKFSPSSNHHECCKFYSIKPKKGEPKEKTNQDFCVYDAVHKDYVYTESWARFLIKNLSDKDTFLKIFPHQKNLIEVQK